MRSKGAESGKDQVSPELKERQWIWKGQRALRR